jgi:hypothetical protein
VAAAGIYGAGSALPVERTIIRGAQFDVPAPIIWQSLQSVPAVSVWYQRMEKLRSLPDPFDPEKNIWHAEYADGNYMVIRDEVLREGMLARWSIVDSDRMDKGNWEFLVTPNQRGSFVKVTAKISTENPWIRFLRRYVLDSDRNISDMLKALGKHFDNPVMIKELAV